MIDIHSHILFGVDDGAESIAASVRMAKIAVASGVTDMIVTPHCNVPDSYGNYWNEELAGRFEALAQALREYDVPLCLHQGQEIYCTSRALLLLQTGALIPLNQTNNVLVEFGFEENPVTVFERAESFLRAGYRPVVAHPERYDFVSQDKETAVILKNMGCFLQVNKGSILGRFGETIKNNALYLLKNRLADVVASDAHSPHMRTPDLREAYNTVAQLVSPAYADLVFTVNPSHILYQK